ncbi:MAG: TRAM domain-containing protein [Candidatus Saccharibacteria bacterium]|nr:TRAM domain-containing protein [Candidatus Saccharibacteria bacterium]
MEIVILCILLVIFIETSFLVYKSLKSHKSRLTPGRRKVYVDSSALMDGRIVKIAQSGFMSDNLIIPRSVIREMQLVADGKDTERRSRARFGMTQVNELERSVHCNVEILQDALDHTPVDERLIELAHENHGIIATNDFNLEKVAEAEGIDVINVNALASVLKSEFLPGEKFTVKIQSTGSNPKQGIGYFQDGTMVVVENGNKSVGKEIEVEFVRFMQTSSGRMIFARAKRDKKRRK